MQILPCGYSRNQLWVGLCRAWNAFTIWKHKNDIGKMREYRRIIHDIQRKLKVPLSEFDIFIGDKYEEWDNDNDNDGNDYEGTRGFASSKSDEELLAQLEEPIYYPDIDQ